MENRHYKMPSERRSMTGTDAIAELTEVYTQTLDGADRPSADDELDEKERRMYRARERELRSRPRVKTSFGVKV